MIHVLSIFLLIVHCGVLGAASSSSSGTGLQKLLAELPFLQFIINPDHCLSVQNKCDSVMYQPYERTDLKSYAHMIKHYELGRLRFLLQMIKDIQVLKLTQQQLNDRMSSSRYVHEDELIRTQNCLKAYFKSGTLQDIMQKSLVLTAHKYFLRNMFRTNDTFKFSNRYPNDSFEDFLLRCIRLEQKRITMIFPTIKNNEWKCALLEAQSRGVQFEIVINLKRRDQLSRTSLQYNVTFSRNIFQQAMCILFEQNIDDKPLAVIAEGVVSDEESRGYRVDAYGVHQKKEVYDAQLEKLDAIIKPAKERDIIVQRSGRVVNAKLAKQKDCPIDISGEYGSNFNSKIREIKMLHAALEYYNYRCFLSPIASDRAEVDSHDFAKRRRKD